MNALATRKRVLSKFKWDVAHVADGCCVFNEFLQHDMCEDMSAIANWVAGGDIENRFDAECVPYSIWELHRSGCWDRCAKPYRNGGPVKVPVIGGRG